MFSLKKSKFRPLAWVRRQVGSRSRRSVDVERRESSIVSAGSGEHPEIPLSVGSARIIMVRPGGNVNTDDAIGVSQSEPIIGPYSNPDNFRFVTEHTGANKKSKSVGAVEVHPAPPGEVGTSELNTNNGATTGLRRRIRKKAVGNAENGDQSSRSAEDGRSQNINQQNDGDEVGFDQNMAVPLQIVIQPTGAAVEIRRPQYLHAFFDIMYLCGISRRVPQDRQGRNGCRAKFESIALLLLFCAVTILSCCDSISQGKNFGMYFLAGEGMTYFMEVSYHIFTLLTKAYAVYRLTLLNEDTDKMLTSITNYDRDHDPQSVCHCNYWKVVILGMCIGTLIMAVLETTFERGLLGWSPEIMGVEKSFDFSQALYLWSYRDLEERNMELGLAHGRPDTYSVGFALTSTLMGIASNFQMGTLRDVALVGVFVIFVIVLALMKGIQETTDNAPKGNIAACRALQTRREMIWKQFCRVREVIEKFNTVFDTLLLLLHMDNLLLAGFFASLCIDVEQRSDLGAFVYFNYAFNLVKVELTYFLAGRVSAQNGLVRKWLWNWSCHTGKIVVDGEEYDVNLLIDQLEKEPLAIGTGIFQMNQEFHLKYHGFALSLVLFLADDKKKKDQCCQSVCIAPTTPGSP